MPASLIRTLSILMVNSLLYPYADGDLNLNTTFGAYTIMSKQTLYEYPQSKSETDGTESDPVFQPAEYLSGSRILHQQEQDPEGRSANFPLPSYEIELASHGTAEARTVKQEQIRDGERNEWGQLTNYKIGPAGGESSVNVTYENKADGSSAVSRLELKKPDGESVVYQKEQKPSGDFGYRETRNGLPGDLLFGGFEVESDGRINLYFDRNNSNLAISINPVTGNEELPPPKQ